MSQFKKNYKKGLNFLYWILFNNLFLIVLKSFNIQDQVIIITNNFLRINVEFNFERKRVDKIVKWEKREAFNNFIF